jgi:hypothetical protein
MTDPNPESVVVPIREFAVAINEDARKAGKFSSLHNRDPSSDPIPDIKSAAAVPSPPDVQTLKRTAAVFAQRHPDRQAGSSRDVHNPCLRGASGELGHPPSRRRDYSFGRRGGKSSGTKKIYPAA